MSQGIHQHASDYHSHVKLSSLLKHLRKIFVLLTGLITCLVSAKDVMVLTALDGSSVPRQRQGPEERKLGALRSIGSP